ncbi:MAG: RlmE family RNA methyltransferase [Pseudomonadota bacterium]
MSDVGDDGKRRWKGPKSDDSSDKTRSRSFATKQKINKGDRKKSSRTWIERQLNDPYVRLAKEAGYRSRAAFKLIDLDERFGLFKRDARVVDLGCAPGGWTQIAIARGSEKVVGIDLLKTDVIADAHLVEGDINDPAAVAAMMSALNGAPTLVLSDMAAATTGHKQTDHVRTVALAETAARFAVEHLAQGGAFCSKVFQGGAQGELLQMLQENFKEVRHWKPPSSRSESPEIFVVAKGFGGA